MTYDQWKTDSGYAERTSEEDRGEPRRCDTGLVGPWGQCYACDAAQGEHCRNPCASGCQYSKDVGMWPEHRCVGACQYAHQ